MKERMNQIAKGVIYKELPIFYVTPDRISRQIEAGKNITCDLMIRTRGEVPVKGLVFSSDPHIVISSNGFSGYVCRILIEIKAGIGENGKVIKGHLTIVTENGELLIPYDIEIIESVSSKDSLPNTVEKFCDMAYEDWQSTANLFTSSKFLNCPFFKDMELLSLYQGLIKGKNPLYAMEEFLIALGMKKPAVIEVENITEERNGKVSKVLFLLKQKEWGYAEVFISTKKDTLMCISGKESFLDFHGTWNTFDIINLFPQKKMEGIVEIPVKEHLLHAGVNEAIVSISDGKRTIEHTIQIKVGNGCSLEHKEKQKDKKEMIQAITALFAQKYAANKGTGDAWRRNSAARNLAEISATMWERYPKLWSLPLIQAVAWMEAGECERAITLLYQIKSSIVSRRYEEPHCYALYLYLEESLKHNDKNENVCNELRDLYKKEPNEFIFYYLSEVDIQWIGKPTRMLQELESYFQKGVHSSFLYGKACQILQSIPDFINIKSAFQRQALFFGVNYDLLTVDTIVHVATQVLEQDRPHWFLYYVLTHMYGRTQNKIVLQALIHVLLKHKKQDRKYFAWYERGMKENFSEQGLARFYLITAPEASYEPFLKQILLYYSYEDNLEPMLQEKLYTNVYQFYQSDKRIFSLYSSRIEKLMAERMIQKKIDHNLAYLYRCMLHPHMVDRRIAGELLDLLHMQQVVGLSSRTKYLILRYPELDMEIKVPCVDMKLDEERTANIPVHRNTANGKVLFFQEDEVGRRMFIQNLQIRQWFHREDLEKICREQYAGQLGFQLEFLQKFLKQGIKGEAEANKLLSLIDKLPVSIPLRASIVREVVDFCYEHSSYDGGDSLLLHLDIGSIDRNRQRMVIDLLVDKGFVGKAQENIHKVGWERLPVQSKIEFFKRWKSSSSNLSADNRMLALCENIMDESLAIWEHQDMSVQSALEYLCAFYSGSQKRMIAILKRGISENCNLYHMPERLLVQSIFSGMWDNLDEIFNWYVKYDETTTLPLRAAYVILSYQYFILQKKVLGYWMEQPFLDKVFDKKPPLICILARLSYLSEQEVWKEGWKEEAEKLLAELLEKEKYFAFYHGLFRHIAMPVWLEGRMILEYRGEKNIKPVLEYERVGWDMEKISVRMDEVYPGIYTQQILLFADEELTYRIYEDREGHQKELYLGSDCQEKAFETEHSHLMMLNQVARCLQQGDMDEADRAIRQIEEETWFIETLFPIKKV